ncbi:MAG: UDPGP type 1 family protein [Phycisphaerae bacterium]|nr:UDPGP type 1 family protein [Phycisphaerae bacterium]
MATAQRPSLDERRSAAAARLREFGQQHLLHFWDRLSDVARSSLLDEIDALPLEMLQRTFADQSAAPKPDPHSILPVDPVVMDRVDTERYVREGSAVIAANRVAAFTVAGGQGTRLGSDAPKGTFPATPILRKSLFEVFAESIGAARARWSARIPWLIMTSPLNHDATGRFFAAHDWFGLGQESVHLIVQGTLPSLDRAGRVLLATESAIALNPDGHGGAVRALDQSGWLNRLAREGIDTLSYFQVDNPLCKPVDALFIGLHHAHPDSSGEVSSKVVAKTSAAEKVGVFCQRGNSRFVMEYSNMPREMTEARDAEGALLHRAGSIAVHVFGVPFLQRLVREGHGLPLHRALKKVPCIDPETGTHRVPTEPNAFKLESFIFDTVPAARRALVAQTTRTEEFAPIKNAVGEDSPATSSALQSERAAQWLERCGVRIARDAATGRCLAEIELSPRTALDAAALATCATLPARIGAGERLTI